MNGIWPYILIILMLILSACFSGTEIAFNASNKLRLKKSAEAGSKTAALAYQISEKFTIALSAILIGNNLANVAASSATTLIIIDVLDALGVSGGKGEALGSTIATIIMTVIILIFGEIVPKNPVQAKRRRGSTLGSLSDPCADHYSLPAGGHRATDSARPAPSLGQRPHC